MNTDLKEGQAAIGRFIELADENAAILTAGIAAMLAKLKLKSAEVDHLGIGQSEGTVTTRSGAADRRNAAKSLRASLVDIAEMARLLDKTTHPGLAALVPPLQKGSYQALQDRAGATVNVLTPIKAEFIANGFAATFLEDVTALSALLGTATKKKYQGLNTQVQSTQTLDFAVKEGVVLMRSINTALRPILRKTDPGLLGAFKTAAHIRARNSKKKTPTPTPAPANGGSTPTTPTGSANPTAPVTPTPTVTP